MANKKFSEFTAQTDSANVQFVVGYNGSDNVRIAPSNLPSGATDLNGLTDCVVNGQNQFIGNVPANITVNALANTSLGKEALNSITTGDTNVAIGNASLSSINSQNNNTAVGSLALQFTTAISSTALGYQAGGFGSGNTNGGSVYIGVKAGRSNIAQGHVSIGTDAGYSNTSGGDNTNVGYHAGFSNTTGQNNTMLGYDTGFHSTGSYNTFVGYRVGYGSSGNTTGARNVAIGDVALTALTSGTGNVSIGTNSGQAITTGNQNVVIGDFAGSSLTTGADNIVIGQNAQPSSATVLNEITLGASNITLLRIPGLGSTDGHVLQYSTSAGGIVLAAAAAGGATDLNGLTDCLIASTSTYISSVPSSVGTTSGNTVVGQSAGNALGSGAGNNTFIGKGASNSQTSGTNNVSIGTSARFNATSGSQLTVIGSSAANNASGTGSVYIGYAAGAGPATTGANCIVIGSLSSSSSTTVSNEITLGDANITSFRIPGIQSGASDGDVLTFNSSAGKLELQAAGGGGASSLNGLTDCTTVGTGNAFIGNVPSNLNSANAAENVAVGIDAGNAMANSDGNTVIGYQAGYINIYGYTTQIGTRAGRNVNAQTNTFIGYEAGQAFGVSSTDAQQNTLIGYRAGNMIRGLAWTGEYAFGCTYLGHQTGSGAGNLTGFNQIVIGRNAAPSSGSVDNEITLGDSNITALRCAVTSITSLSDERDKSEIKDLEYGLAFIDALQPREFVWDNRPETSFEVDEDNNETEVEFYSANKGKKDFGFIAQEVKELDNDTLRLVYDENPDKLELSYGKLVPILVKAIQELKEEIELLKL